MSIGTSLRGKSYENNFKNGFRHKNSAIMENGDFHSSTDSTIYDHTRSDGSNKMRKIPVGDIDAAFINTQVVKVVDLLPVESFLHDRAFQIEANSLIFFELTTTEGANLFLSYPDMVCSIKTKHQNVFRNGLRIPPSNSYGEEDSFP